MNKVCLTDDTEHRECGFTCCRSTQQTDMLYQSSRSCFLVLISVQQHVSQVKPCK